MKTSTIWGPYPDPVTPRCDKDWVQNPAHDPYGVMPSQLPSHPRVFVGREPLKQVCNELKTVAWRAAALAKLQEDCLKDPDPGVMPDDPDTNLNNRLVRQTVKHALVYLITGDALFLKRARQRFLAFCQSAVSWPLRKKGWATSGTLNESHLIKYLGFAYDLIAAAGVPSEEDVVFRQALEASIEASKNSEHTTCSNINAWVQTGRLSVALALGDQQGVHDALYGSQCGKHWRYGLMHQLRHDILADGVHWEGTPGYHMYTMSAISQCLRMLETNGVDLWNKPLPQQLQNEDNDIHRWYGPEGTKTVKSAFDAPLFMAASNGDLSLIHDSGLRNLRGLYVWGVVYAMAYDAYQDPAYAALLQKMEDDYPPAKRQHPDLPMVLNTHSGLTDFARILRSDWTQGTFSRTPDRTIGINGRHQHGSTLFPMLGMAVLRAQPDRPDGINAFIRWSPHVAGHMHPAALHLDIVADNRQWTDAARTGGYADPNHLTWARTTIAANTLTVDRRSMFPYDFETSSIWECDYWRDRVSDGKLISFQPEPAIRSVRAINRTVYPGVLLDRTIIVREAYVLDIYQATSDSEHDYDWTMHAVGQATSEGIPLPNETDRGYEHLSNMRLVASREDSRLQTVAFEKQRFKLSMLLPDGAQLILADDPPVPSKEDNQKPILGELDDALSPRTLVMARQRACSLRMVSLWSSTTSDVELVSCQQTNDRSLNITVNEKGQPYIWNVAGLREDDGQASVSFKQA